MADLSGAKVDLSGVTVDISGAVTKDLSGATVAKDLSGVTVAKDLSGATVAKDLSGATVAKDLSGATVAKDLSGATVAKDLSGATVAKDLSGAVVVVDSDKNCCSCCCAKAKPAVKEWVDEKPKTVTDLSGVVADLVKELSTASVEDVILALPRLLAAAREAGAADNSELVKLKHAARGLLSQCVKDDRAASAFADTYLHAVCAALLGSFPGAAKPVVAAVSVVEKKVTSGGRSWFVCWKR
jgi:hypothetical protein